MILENKSRMEVTISCEVSNLPVEFLSYPYIYVLHAMFVVWKINFAAVFIAFICNLECPFFQASGQRL